MSLINCPECKKEISSFAKSCPHCGFPLKRTIQIDDKKQKSDLKETAIDKKEDLENASKEIPEKILCRKCGAISNKQCFCPKCTSLEIEDIVVKTEDKPKKCKMCSSFFIGKDYCPNCNSLFIDDEDVEAISDTYNIPHENIFPSGLYIISTLCLAVAMFSLSLVIYTSIYLAMNIVSIACAFTYLVITCIAISKEWKYYKNSRNKVIRINYGSEILAMILSMIILISGLGFLSKGGFLL